MRGWQRSSIGLVIVFLALLGYTFLQPEKSEQVVTLYSARATQEQSVLENTDSGETYIIPMGQTVRLVIPDDVNQEALQTINSTFNVSVLEQEFHITNDVSSVLKTYPGHIASFRYESDSGWIPLP